MTPALSSKYKVIPSLRFHALRCLITIAGVTFFLKSGLPFLTVARTTSPGAAAGNLFNLAPNLWTAMMYKFFAPELSAQFMTAATGKPKLILYLLDVLAILVDIVNYKNYLIDIDISRVCMVIPNRDFVSTITTCFDKDIGLHNSIL
eukprot:NODE_970_length_2685_cov_0.314772.p2 type:complete len:147 gc:universal NODE_970_length_2685_cov_0.314772:1257-817(-)